MPANKHFIISGGRRWLLGKCNISPDRWARQKQLYTDWRKHQYSYARTYCELNCVLDQQTVQTLN